jgi:PTH1 family peptidyl-tRNA hydrolase
MNRSGLAVAAFLERQDIDRAELLVVCDDFNLPLGRLRFRPGGSDGGQKGLRSVAEHIGTEEFKRLRLGVGPLPEGADPVEFVLGSFDPAEIEIVQKTVAVAAEGVIFAVHHRFDEVMGQYNTNNNPALPDSE